MREIPEVTDADVAYGCVKHMPKMDEIPKEYQSMMGTTKWHRAQSDWFYKGISMDSLVVKPGVDKVRATRAIQAIQCSWEPKHEHKVSAVAYLLSEWFDDYLPKGDSNA